MDTQVFITLLHGLCCGHISLLSLSHPRIQHLQDQHAVLAELHSPSHSVRLSSFFVIWLRLTLCRILENSNEQGCSSLPVPSTRSPSTLLRLATRIRNVIPILKEDQGIHSSSGVPLPPHDGKHRQRKLSTSSSFFAPASDGLERRQSATLLRSSSKKRRLGAHKRNLSTTALASFCNLESQHQFRTEAERIQHEWRTMGWIEEQALASGSSQLTTTDRVDKRTSTTSIRSRGTPRAPGSPPPFAGQRRVPSPPLPQRTASVIGRPRGDSDASVYPPTLPDLDLPEPILPAVLNVTRPRGDWDASVYPPALDMVSEKPYNFRSSQPTSWLPVNTTHPNHTRDSSCTSDSRPPSLVSDARSSEDTTRPPITPKHAVMELPALPTVVALRTSGKSITPKHVAFDLPVLSTVEALRIVKASPGKQRPVPSVAFTPASPPRYIQVGFAMAGPPPPRPARSPRRAQFMHVAL
jgi:hypothetical protein